jgi:hypothetical protein
MYLFYVQVRQGLVDYDQRDKIWKFYPDSHPGEVYQYYDLDPYANLIVRISGTELHTGTVLIDDPCHHIVVLGAATSVISLSSQVARVGGSRASCS